MRNAARRGDTANYRLESVAGAGNSPQQTGREKTASKDATAAALEKKCYERVASVTGSKVAGTNRIEHSEAATAIYVNVKGAQAPWRCLGYRNGTIGDVMYTGSEGSL
ncbi:hypothetical protein [Novosphingobium sp. TCA1]|uniref:hypothetical protein n=1 Tax=Novosphingobium sp. TCA1 TaxID=2682474 RepID=UPI0013586810|nr:hypothetical protein [Novosphingobium sp. TCA1]